MIVVCPSCQSRYRFDEAKLGDRPRATTRCAKCGGAIEIENVRGDVVGDTGSGSIDATRINGSFLGDTGSSSVRVTGVEGERVLAACKEKNVGTTIMKSATGIIEMPVFDPENPNEQVQGWYDYLEEQG